MSQLFVGRHEYAAFVSNHPRRYYGTQELHFIIWK
jgi:hypothetical protein